MLSHYSIPPVTRFSLLPIFCTFFFFNTGIIKSRNIECLTSGDWINNVVHPYVSIFSEEVEHSLLERKGKQLMKLQSQGFQDSPAFPQGSINQKWVARGEGSSVGPPIGWTGNPKDAAFLSCCLFQGGLFSVLAALESPMLLKWPQEA